MPLVLKKQGGINNIQMLSPVYGAGGGGNGGEREGRGGGERPRACKNNLMGVFYLSSFQI